MMTKGIKRRQSRSLKARERQPRDAKILRQDTRILRMGSWCKEVGRRKAEKGMHRRHGFFSRTFRA